MTFRNVLINALGALFMLPLLVSTASAQSSCGQIPSLKVWGGITNARVERYVDQKLDGDWQPYVNHLAKELETLKTLQETGKSVQVRYKGQSVRLTGQQLDVYVKASQKRFDVVQCLSGQNSDLQAAQFNNFATAAGAPMDEKREVEVEVNRTSSGIQNASVASGALRLDVQTSCENGSSIFKVTNKGEEWPKSSIFAIYRLGGAGNQVISSRRMRLKPNQSSTFRIKATRNPTGELGLFVDPSWYKRGFDYDAIIRCR